MSKKLTYLIIALYFLSMGAVAKIIEVAPADARMNVMIVGGGAPAGAPACADSSCTGFEICQNFESTGYDNSESEWSEGIGSNGIVDEDDQTATVLRGSYQLKVFGGDAGQSSYARFTFPTALDEIYLHFRLKTPAANADDVVSVIFRDASQGSDLDFYIRGGSDRFRVLTASGDVYPTDTYSDSTAYHVWIHYKNDGTGSMGFSTDTTEPTAGNKYGTYSSGSTDSIKSIDFRADSEETIYVDQVIVKTTAIGQICD